MEKYLIRKHKRDEHSRDGVAVDNESQGIYVEDTDNEGRLSIESKPSCPDPNVESEESGVTLESELTCTGPSRESEVAVESESSPSGLSVVRTRTRGSKDSPGKSFRLYNESYLGLGFTRCDDEFGPKPKCVVCGIVLSNESMTLMKMKRHLTTKHSHLSEKSVDYFKRLLKDNKQQRLGFEKKVTVAEKAQKANYFVAEQTVKQMKPPSVAESYFFPASCAVVKTLFGDEAENELKKIPQTNQGYVARYQKNCL